MLGKLVERLMLGKGMGVEILGWLVTPNSGESPLVFEIWVGG